VCQWYWVWFVLLVCPLSLCRYNLGSVALVHWYQMVQVRRGLTSLSCLYVAVCGILLPYLVDLLVWVLLAGLCWFLGCLLLSCASVLVAASVLYVCVCTPYCLYHDGCTAVPVTGTALDLALLTVVC
jgi:hypothetical protein